MRTARAVVVLVATLTLAGAAYAVPGVSPSSVTDTMLPGEIVSVSSQHP